MTITFSTHIRAELHMSLNQLSSYTIVCWGLRGVLELDTQLYTTLPRLWSVGKRFKVCQVYTLIYEVQCTCALHNFILTYSVVIYDNITWTVTSPWVPCTPIMAHHHTFQQLPLLSYVFIRWRSPYHSRWKQALHRQHKRTVLPFLPSCLTDHIAAGWGHATWIVLRIILLMWAVSNPGYVVYYNIYGFADCSLFCLCICLID